MLGFNLLFFAFSMSKSSFLSIRGARVHNLKNIDIDLPKNALVVITGLSGSGKSSLAFDTIYQEGQRRYMESLSSHTRSFLELKEKPDVDEISGLSPTIAIDQKSASYNPRSTVGTTTEIYDYLRLLFARAGQPHCPKCGQVVIEQNFEQILLTVSRWVQKGTVELFAPIIQNQKGEHRHVLLTAKQTGFSFIRFDTTVMEIDEALALRKDKQKPHTIELLIASLIQEENTTSKTQWREILKKGLDYGNGLLILVLKETGEECLLSQYFHCPHCQINLPPLEPRYFSFNTPEGACTECTGLGVKLVFDPNLLIPNKRLTIAEGAIRPWSRVTGNQTSFFRLIDTVGRFYKFSIHTPLEKYSKQAMHVLMFGTGAQLYEVDKKEVEFSGILRQLEQKYKETDSEYIRHEFETYMYEQVCPICEGKRLRPEFLAVTFAQKSLADMVSMSLENFLDFFKRLQKHPDQITDSITPPSFCQTRGHDKEMQQMKQMVFERVSKEVVTRLEHLCEIGLGYLTLDRTTMTLSGGEAQRVRLANQLGRSLSGVIYVLDEPSIGLHSRDTEALIKTLRALRDLGNTVLVVEHDRQIIEAADAIVDVGPGAGIYGGEIVAQGTLVSIKHHKESLTGQYLSGKKTIPLPKKYRKGNGHILTIVDAESFNLKKITVSFPLGTLTCVTGVSGSGKSTLVLDILGNALLQKFYRTKTPPGKHKEIKGMEHLDKVVVVDQSPIGRTPRSNPATYTGVFTAIRDLFASVPEAKMRGYNAGKFSFNVKGGGRCEVCSGDGVRHIEMQFMPDVYVTCEECHGTRYHSETLEIHYRGKSIADVLAMTIEEARLFFCDQATIYEKLHVLFEVGLGYLQLGQSATTLSGGEAQRVKLSTELSRRTTGKTLYILDEPTTGLHFEDTKRLLLILERLVDKGNTVIIIEHNMDVIKVADWIIDMGPEGGEKGGQVIAQATPKDLLEFPKNETAKFLKVCFEKNKNLAKNVDKK